MVKGSRQDGPRHKASRQPGEDAQDSPSRKPSRKPNDNEQAAPSRKPSREPSEKTGSIQPTRTTNARTRRQRTGAEEPPLPEPPEDEVALIDEESELGSPLNEGTPGGPGWTAPLADETHNDLLAPSWLEPNGPSYEHGEYPPNSLRRKCGSGSLTPPTPLARDRTDSRFTALNKPAPAPAITAAPVIPSAPATPPLYADVDAYSTPPLKTRNYPVNSMRRQRW